MPDRTIPVNSKTVAAGLGAIGVVALAAAGLVTITTPGEEQCKEQLTEVRVAAATELGECKADLSGAQAENEQLEEAKDACKVALESLTRRSP